MDIIDIMLAKAMTPQGKTDTYVAKANKAAAKAEKAKQDAQIAIDTVEAAATEIATARSEAADLLAEAQETLTTAQQAQINMPEAYNTTGQNTDGYMTQKAVTDALDTKASTDALAQKADKTYVDQQIASIPSGGGSSSSILISFDPEDVGYLTMVDNSGNLVASNIQEQTLIETLLQMGTFPAQNALGLDIDYANRAFTRTQEAGGKSMGVDFDEYSMYGGRIRCNVADDGTINAFYGEEGYKDDGSNGQVMIYQPKFYYKRIIRTADELNIGKAIRHETLIISPTEQVGFKLAPIFEGELDYVLLPAYDASLVDNKLASIAGARPVNNITISQAEAYANARGNGWHIMNMAAESANQMLEIVEFGTMNGQVALEQGLSYLPDNFEYYVTGSTASLGNGTGHAASTDAYAGGTLRQYSEEGYRAISYRGMENPWGNLWSMIYGVRAVGNGQKNGGSIEIKNANGQYVDTGFTLPSAYGWVNAMAYGSENYDWVYMPAECSDTANSFLPVGDNIWTIANLNGTMCVATGGSAGYKENCGPFYYAADRSEETTSRHNYGAKLLFIPTKNEIYNANITKWIIHMGG